MPRKSLSSARLHVAMLGAALSVSFPIGALAENWVAVMEQEGVGTYCVDRDSIRWEGSGVSYATQYCTSSHPGLAGSPSGNWVDCAQDLSGDLVYVSDENGQWDRVHASSPSGTAARAVCQGL